MDYENMSTANLLMLLASRLRRLDEWDRSQRYANWPRARGEYSESDDDAIVIDVSAEIGRRIDAGHTKEQS